MHRVANWAPILEPGTNAALEAQDAVCTIARVIRDSYPAVSTFHGRPLLHENSLLFGYLARAGWPGDWAELAATHLNLAVDLAVDRVATDAGGLGLYGGLCGLGWVLDHLNAALGGAAVTPDSQPDLNQDTDEVVIRALGRSWRNKPYDLISGLVGCGVYFLERMPRESAARGVGLVVSQLENLAHHADGCLTWYSGPELLPDWERKHHPHGYFNLGVAHGIPGILHFLSESAAAGVERPRCARLLEQAMHWFIARRRPQGSKSWYGEWLDDGKQNDSRLAWCYGDLGILAVMLQIARRTDRRDWQEFAAGLLQDCLERSEHMAEAGVKDAPLCHGAVGVAHIFNRIYQAEGNPRCRAASLVWFERALSMRRPGFGLAGFSTWRIAHGQDALWESNPAFIDGAIGVALALLAALTPIDPGWDRMLLLSGRHFGQ